MKRLVLRITALAVVVVLGWIAIAQAQRGYNDPTSPSASADTLANEPNPLRQSTDSTSSSGNPLPGRGGHATVVDEPAPNRMPVGDTTLLSTANDLSPSGQMMPRRAADPFYRPVEYQQPSSDPPADQGVTTHDDIPAAFAGDFQNQQFVSDNDSLPPGSTEPAELPAMSGFADSPPQLAAPVGSNPMVRSPQPSATPETAIPPAAKASPYGTQTVQDPRLSPNSSPYTPVVQEDRYSTPLAGSDYRQPSPLDLQTSGAQPLAADGGTGLPGDQQLEGPQSPHLIIQKLAPQEIQVGRPALFKITVVNDGTVAADNVEVHDVVPKGTQLVGTNPRASRGTAGELVWELGTLKPGDESTVEIQLMPIAEGEIGSVATVRFSTDASAKSIATKPELVVKSSAPTQVLIGDKVKVQIEVSNPGSGTATGVVLAEQVPAGLKHEAGSALEYEIGELGPGESRKLELELTAASAGRVANVLTVQGDYNLSAEDRADIEIIAPELAVAVDGPKRRYLEREAVYKLSVSNPGTAPARNVQLVAYLPSGMKFVSADNAGYYEDSDQTVRWNLEELPTKETGTVSLVALPIEAGSQQIRLQGTTEKGLTAEHAQTVAVEGIAEVCFQVVDVADPIEVGGQTTYEVRVTNKGSKAATNVRMLVSLPNMRPLSAEGPARYEIQGSSVRFEPIPRLAAKADTTFRIRAQSLRAGDLRVQVQLQSDGMDSPVIKQESTRVYADE